MKRQYWYCKIGTVKSSKILYFVSFESLLAFLLYNYSDLSDEPNLLKSCHHGSNESEEFKWKIHVDEKDMRSKTFNS